MAKPRPWEWSMLLLLLLFFFFLLALLLYYRIYARYRKTYKNECRF